MQRVKSRLYLMPLAICSALNGCADSGVQAAYQWMSDQQRDIPPVMLAAVPPVVDTPPAKYSSKAVDPFSPERISTRAGTTGGSLRADVLFPDAPLSGLSVMGYLSGDNRVPVAMVRYGIQYRGVHVGDRLSDQAAAIKQIGPQGVLLSIDGQSDRWLTISKQ